MVAIDFHCIFFFILWKSMATSNYLIPNILQNIFCVQQKKETDTGLEQLEDGNENVNILGWTINLNMKII